MTATVFAPAVQGQEDASSEDDGAGELVTDRPDVTESTSIIVPGWLQMELGGSIEGEADRSSLSVPGSLLRIGVLPRLEARLGWEGYVEDLDEDEDGVGVGGAGGPAAATESPSGAQDGEVSVKILLLERSGPRPALALLPAVTIPIGENGLTTDAFDPGVKVLLANDFSGRTGWGANVGAAWPTVPAPSGTDSDGERDGRPLWSWSYSVGIDLSPTVGAFFEYFGESPPGDATLHSLDAGFTYGPAADIQLDVSGALGLNDAAPDWALGGGLAFRMNP